MLRHVVLLRFTDGTDPSAADAVAASLRALPPQIPSIRAYAVGRDLGLAPDNADLVVVADFDDAEGHAEYRDHPAHVAVVDQQISPILASRTAIQFEV